jgi:hypothetical protein
MTGRNYETWLKWYVAYRDKNRERINATTRAWHAANRDKARAYYHANKEKLAPSFKRWKAANKEHTNAYAKAWHNNRYATDPEFRLRKLLRRHSTRINRPNRKAGTSVAYLGCTIAEAKRHIESLWAPGMTWENHSLHGWHIDHVIPLAAFDFTDEEQAKKALHYTNLQPMWAKDNLRKGKQVLV